MIRGFLRSAGTKWALGWGLLAAAYGALWCALFPDLVHESSNVTEAALTLGMGLVLGLRVNKAYDRWWEGRRLWGKLVNVNRNLAVKLRSFGHPDPEEAARLAQGIAGFAYALRDHLREGASLPRVQGYEARPERPTHVPSWMARTLYDVVHAWRTEGRITDEEMRTLDLEARELLEVCGACERIKNTPMPPSLPVIVRITMFLVLLGLPMTLAPQLGWGTVPIMFGVAFFITLGESTATVMEQPFGADPNQIDLTRLCGVIEATTVEILTAEDPAS